MYIRALFLHSRATDTMDTVRAKTCTSVNLFRMGTVCQIVFCTRPALMTDYLCILQQLKKDGFLLIDMVTL